MREISQLDQLEHKLAGHRKDKESRQALIRLTGNRDFQQIIVQEFCITECARYAQISGDPTLTVEQRQDALGMAQAAGFLRRYLSMREKQTENTDASIEETESEIELIRVEQDEAAGG